MIDKNTSRPGELSFEHIKTYPVRERHNLVTIDNLAAPGVDPVPEWGAPAFSELVDRIVDARRNGRPVIWSMGAHVIKNGLSRYIIDLMKRGLITHVCSNGAGSIHDFELSFLSGTSEDVPTAIADGSFGMWEETGRWMNEALQAGARKGLGYGESLAVCMEENPDRFPYREDCVLFQAYRNSVPATYHIAIGTDIIHQHPIVDFAAIGATSGVDFRRLCHSVAHLDGGVFLNFGSSVIGPEVFLKALSIARNLGYPTFRITTANFDLIDVGNDHEDFGYQDPLYYYRPLKNIVTRPTHIAGKGWHFCGNHLSTVPNLHHMLLERLPEAPKGIRELR